MKLVVLESPYAGDISRNILYARRSVRDSLSRGESPYAGHLLHTQPGILDDSIPSEREWGIEAHMAWIPICDSVVVYEDYGISKGMNEAIKFAESIRKRLIYRTIGKNGT